MIVLYQGIDGWEELEKSCNMQLISLPDVKNGDDNIYILQGDKILELQSANPRRFASWFIDQRVSSDSAIYVASRVDVKFLLLPYLEKESSKYRPIDQIVSSRFPLEHSSSWKLMDICDINDKLGDDMILYRYNESKTVIWLRAKVDRTAKVLCSQRRRKCLLENQLIVSNFNISAQSSLNTAADDNDHPSTSNDSPALEIGIVILYINIFRYIEKELKNILIQFFHFSGGSRRPATCTRYHHGLSV